MEDKVTKMTQPQVTATQKPALACFVAGTLVHTQTGLRRIEEIKVGDYVLSKPENGEGEPSYKRVIKTFEYDDKEVWAIEYNLAELVEEQNEVGVKETDKREFFVATGNHPIWVKGLYRIPSKFYSCCQYEVINEWIPAKELNSERFTIYSAGAVLELADGRIAVTSNYGIGGLLTRSDKPQLGLILSELPYDGNELRCVDFSSGRPIAAGWNYLNIDDLYEGDCPEGSVAKMGDGYPPLLRKVYNLEVEDNHTYYVGELGVWVHNTCVDFN